MNQHGQLAGLELDAGEVIVVTVGMRGVSGG